VAFQAPPPAALPPLPGPLPLSEEQVRALDALAVRQAPPPPAEPPRVKTPEEKRLERKIDKALLAMPHGLESVIIAKAAGNTWKDSILKTKPVDDAILEEEVDLLGPTLDRWLGDHREKFKWFLVVKLHARHCSNALVEAEEMVLARRARELAAAAPPPPPPPAPRVQAAPPPTAPQIAPSPPPAEIDGGGPEL
jgi:hypothetical protein